MLPVPNYLADNQKVIDAFGYWPSFHDSPVTRFEVIGDEIFFELKAWEMTNKTDSDGYFILTKRHDIGFRFCDIISKNLEDFIPENIIDLLGFSSSEEFDKQGVFTVDLDSAMGSDLCGKFAAKLGEVTFVRPDSRN
jgi:hypothetical protein